MNKCTFCCTKLESVSVKKGEAVLLEDITMHIHCNEILAIIGPNGAGKSTLFKALLGEMKHTGKIDDVMHQESGKKSAPVIGYVPQHLNFDRNAPISVLDLFTCSVSKKPAWLGIPQSFRKEVELILAEIGMVSAIDKRLGNLSGGELQKILVALALTPKPDILLLDEPISGVDMQGKRSFYQMLKELTSSHHMAIVMITHDIPILESICDRAILLNKTILAQGTPKQLKETQQMIDIFGL